MFAGLTYIPPWALQAVGIAMLVFFVGFWAVSGRVEPLLIGVSGTMIGLGEARAATAKLRTAADALPPEEDKP